MQQNKADKFNLTNFMKYKYIIFIDKIKNHRNKDPIKRTQESKMTYFADGSRGPRPTPGSTGSHTPPRR